MRKNAEGLNLPGSGTNWKVADLAVLLAMGGTLLAGTTAALETNQTFRRWPVWVKTCTLWLGQLAQQS